MGLFFYFS